MLRSVLIVEDSLSISQALKAQMLDMGVKNVTCAFNGLEALDKIAQSPEQFHGILTDLNMPKMDGMEFLIQLGHKGYQGGVIVISALEDRVIEAAVDLARRQHVHLVGFLSKPIDINKLTLMIHRIKHLKRFVTLSEKLLKRAQLFNALQENRIIPYYQPKLDGKTNQLKGFEVLCRLHIPEESQVISPERFIPVAQKLGMIDDLTQQLLNTAFSEFREIAKASREPNLKLAFNLIPDQLQNIKLPTLLDNLCQQFGLHPRNIIVEITERQALEKSVQLATMDRLRIHGYGVSLDDFGTGFTNMGQLRSHPFSEIKLDESLVSNISQDRFSQIILNSMSNIAQELNINLVAEGVDNIDDFNYIIEHSNAQIQGFIVSRPKPKNEIIRWINARGVQQTRQTN